MLSSHQMAGRANSQAHQERGGEALLAGSFVVKDATYAAMCPGGLGRSGR